MRHQCNWALCAHTLCLTYPLWPAGCRIWKC